MLQTLSFPEELFGAAAHRGALGTALRRARHQFLPCERSLNVLGGAAKLQLVVVQNIAVLREQILIGIAGELARCARTASGRVGQHFAHGVDGGRECRQ